MDFIDYFPHQSNLQKMQVGRDQILRYDYYIYSKLSSVVQIPEKKSDEEVKRQEQEDLQLAMALSVSEQDTKQVRYVVMGVEKRGFA